jgi:hypothetical protein
MRDKSSRFASEGRAAETFDSYHSESIARFDRSEVTESLATAAAGLIIGSLFTQWITFNYSVKHLFGLITREHSELIAPVELWPHLIRAGYEPLNITALVAVALVAICALAPIGIYASAQTADTLQETVILDKDGMTPWPLRVGSAAFNMLSIVVCGLSLSYWTLGFWMFAIGNAFWALAMFRVLSAAREMYNEKYPSHADDNNGTSRSAST